MFNVETLASQMEELAIRHREIEALLIKPEIVGNRKEFTALSKEHARLTELVTTWHTYCTLNQEINDAKHFLLESDKDMKDLAQSELVELEISKKQTGEALQLLLLPEDPHDEKNTVLEIRAGTGGDEAALFAGDLYRMYMRFAERNQWTIETLSVSTSMPGSIKEVFVLIKGAGVYSRLKYESGVHRVQRVPSTESSGRIHTSAATVVVLPEADTVDINIDDKELRIDVMRAGGPGGQSVNTTDSAVRLTHLPTGLIVICQDEKSQHKNKSKAMKILSARLLDLKKKEQEAEERSKRRTQIKSGDRSEKVRTYNFPQDRLTDHRINLTKHNLDSILDGNLDEIINALRAHYQTEALKEAQF